MEPEFWHGRWRRGQIGFHQDAVHPMLRAHLNALGLSPGARVLVPLCGKSHDLGWLRAQGFRVVGVELSPLAVDRLFADLGETPAVMPAGTIERRDGAGLTVFVGDLFSLTPDLLGPVDAVYDRAALVALPPAMRPRYAAHLTRLAPGAPHLLISFDYDQSAMDGPPFSVDAAEIARLHPAARLLARAAVAGGLKGAVAACETVWKLG